jgi:hypothetical protein
LLRVRNDSIEVRFQRLFGDDKIAQFGGDREFLVRFLGDSSKQFAVLQKSNHLRGVLIRSVSPTQFDCRLVAAADPGLTIVHANAGGIDVGNESHYVAVPPNRDPNAVREFGCCYVKDELISVEVA